MKFLCVKHCERDSPWSADQQHQQHPCPERPRCGMIQTDMAWEPARKTQENHGKSIELGGIASYHLSTMFWSKPEIWLV